MLLLTKECALRRNYAFFLDAGGSSLKKDLKIDPNTSKKNTRKQFLVCQEWIQPTPETSQN